MFLIDKYIECENQQGQSADANAKRLATAFGLNASKN